MRNWIVACGLLLTAHFLMHCAPTTAHARRGFIPSMVTPRWVQVQIMDTATQRTLATVEVPTQDQAGGVAQLRPHLLVNTAAPEQPQRQVYVELELDDLDRAYGRMQVTLTPLRDAQTLRTVFEARMLERQRELDRATPGHPTRCVPLATAQAIAALQQSREEALLRRDRETAVQALLPDGSQTLTVRVRFFHPRPGQRYSSGLQGHGFQL